MAKRNLDKTPGSDDSTKAPERRRRTTSTDVTGKAAAPRTRGRRKTDVTAEPSPVTTANDSTMSPLQAADAPTPAAGLTAAAHAEAGNGHDDVQVPHDHIALRAYHLYLERGRQPGDQFLDWVTAERQLREQATRASR